MLGSNPGRGLPLDLMMSRWVRPIVVSWQLPSWEGVASRALPGAALMGGSNWPGRAPYTCPVNASSWGPLAWVMNHTRVICGGQQGRGPTQFAAV